MGILDDAQARDAADPLQGFRDEFLIPPHGGGEQVYLCGNSLGLQPRATKAALLDELEDWHNLAVEAHFRGRHPWMPYHEFVRENLAELVGARPSEVVAMNSLTANLHLMMVSFYRPTRERRAILIEKNPFPSDRYAVESQIRLHGFDPADALIELGGDEANGGISDAAIERALDEHGSRIALVLLPGVQYLNGQVFDLRRIAALAHRHGCTVGFDLAHAVGNVPVDLHDSGADFAVWCSYKYLNAGPGAVAGCFVHERHGHDAHIARLAGWWGHDPQTRFQMLAGFQPQPGAEGWQLSNPPILALAPLRASLEIFDALGMKRLRARSEVLTGYMEFLLRSIAGERLEILTPPVAQERGCQLSVRVRDGAADLFAALQRAGVVCDFREPNVLRVAPVPLYNTCEEIWRFAEIVRATLGNPP